MDKVIHFELPADNVERAKKFYKEVFLWDLKDIPEMNYILINTSGPINGGMFKRDIENNSLIAPSFSVLVENIDEAIKRIKNAGGLLIKDKSPVGNMGLIAYFKDTEGNILSIWQAIKTQ